MQLLYVIEFTIKIKSKYIGLWEGGVRHSLFITVSHTALRIMVQISKQTVLHY